MQSIEKVLRIPLPFRLGDLKECETVIRVTSGHVTIGQRCVF